MVGLPSGNVFLNAKERKRLLHVLDRQFGVSSLPEGVFLMNAKQKVYLITRDIDRIPFERLRIDALGLYLGAWQADGFRLSLEGAQLFASQLTKGVVFLDDSQRRDWLKGLDLPWPDVSSSAFVVVRHERTGDVLGSGKFRFDRQSEKDGLLLNYTPKSRRLIVVNE